MAWRSPAVAGAVGANKDIAVINEQLGRAEHYAARAKALRKQKLRRTETLRVKGTGMAYELVFERTYTTGISGVVKAEKAVKDDTIAAYAVDPDGRETLVSTSSLALWRLEAVHKYPDITQPYCGFNLPFPWAGSGSLPKSVVLKIGDRVVKRFDHLKDPMNDFGLQASDVLGLCDRSFFGLDGMTMDGGLLRILGVLTPPAGEVHDITFTKPEGVAANFVWPISAEEAAKYYWYVPGAPYLGFRIDIALADCAEPLKHHFEFGLHIKGESPEYNSLRNVTVPLSFDALMNFPPQYNIERVLRVQNRIGASVAGATDAHRILKIAARHKSLDQPFRILDWGCGFGRVARHLQRFAPNAEVLGADIDDENLTWMAGNMPHVKPVSSDIKGHIEQADKSVDIAFGISVMTHLRVDVMKVWLKELCRIVKDDGLLLLTVAGAGSLAFSSRWVKPTDYQTWQSEGLIVFRNNSKIDRDIGGEDYYVQSHINEEQVRAVWSEYVDVLEFIPTIFGYQDMVVCRPKKK
jgi:SAM-dependent methyltransferase